MLEFHGGMQPNDLLDWFTVVEDIFNFKEVLKDKKVGLVATRLQERASTWWQQVKATRIRKRKRKIEIWEKMKKYTCVELLPNN